MADDKDVEGKGGAGARVGGKGETGKEVDGRGGPNGSADLVNDIVNRATALGGFLVVSFVAPLPPSGMRTGNRSAPGALESKLADNMQAWEAARKAPGPK